MRPLMQDLYYTLRALRRSPGYAALAVLALALGIGANIAIFSVVNAVLWRSLPYADSARLVTILHGGFRPVAAANLLDWRARAHSFSAMEAAGVWSPTVSSGSEQAESVTALRVSPGMFGMLGVPPVQGRYLTAADATAPVAVLSAGFAERHFGGVDAAAGRTLLLDGQPYTVVGVMPRQFQFAPFWVTDASLWVPLDLEARRHERAAQIWRVFARLKPGVSLAEARAEMNVIASRLAAQYPDDNTGLDAQVIPLKEKVIGSIRPTLLVLLGTVACVLLIACVNLALLILARATGRSRELAIRAALGAGRQRLLSLLLTESTLLSLAGGLLGLVLAWFGVAYLLASLPDAALPRQHEIGLDWPVFVFALLLSTGTGLLAGAVPAWQMARRDVNESLKDGSRGQSRGPGRRLSRRWLLSAQAALTLVLLTAAGLLLESFQRLQSIDPGFRPESLLTFHISVAGTGQASRRPLFYEELTTQLRHLPGVEAAAAVNHVPLAGDTWYFNFYREGDPLPAAGQRSTALFRVAQAGYFGAMRIPLVQGRDFSSADQFDRPGVVIINQTMARRHWPAGVDPVGRRITLTDPRNPHTWLTIIGVVKDVRQREWAGAPREEFYLPLSQSEDYLRSPQPHYSSMSFVVRTAGDPTLVARSVRETVFRLDRHVPISRIASMTRIIEDALWRERVSLDLLGAFSLTALLLALAGIYAVVSYAVQERTPEMSIRLALGASPSQVMALTMREGLTPVITGLLAGALLAAAFAYLLRGLLYGVDPLNPRTIASVSLILLICAAGANWLPARRLLTLDPVRALRSE